jgi:signal transduction histidine kinase
MFLDRIGRSSLESELPHPHPVPGAGLLGARMPSALSFEKSLSRYASALLATGIALLIRLILSPVLDGYLPYVTLFAAVAFSAWFCGVWPSILSLLVAAIGARYWLIHPTHSFSLPDFPQSLGLAAFLVSAGLIVALGEAGRRERERHRIVHEKLEAQIRQQASELGHANQHVRDLTGHVLHLQDEERRRLARELHDGVGQSVAALSMNLTAIGAELERLAKTASKVADSTALVSDMSRDIRTISHLLHPPLLDEVGLRPALQWYIEGFAERSKIAVDLDLPEEFGRLPREAETAVFRIVQECLTNIHRHSESPVAKVRVIRYQTEVQVEVRDQGKGMPKEKLAEIATSGAPGVGFRGMRERLNQLGGSLEIESNGNGTVVVAKLPVPASSSRAAVASGR